MYGKFATMLVRVATWLPEAARARSFASVSEDTTGHSHDQAD